MSARVTWLGGCLIAALSSGVVSAQPAMDFRPVPADSIREYERTIRERAQDRGTETRDRIRASLDSLDGDAVTAGSPEPPEPPTPPDVARTSSTGDVIRLGSDVHIAADEVIVGDVVSIGGNVDVEGTVHGSVTSIGGDVRLDSTARVDGDVVTLGGTLHESPGSSVSGQRVTTAGPRFGHALWPFLGVLGAGYKMVLGLLSLLFTVGIAWLVVKLAPRRTEAAMDTIRREGGMSFLIGLLVWGLLIPSVVVLALLIALLCITIIGIPLAAAVAVGYCALLVLLLVWGFLSCATFVGLRLRERLRPGPYSLVAGAIWGVVALQGLRIVADLLGIVPVFGIIGGMIRVIQVVAFWVVTTIGMGALIRTEYRAGSIQSWWRRIRPVTPGGTGARGVQTPEAVPAFTPSPPVDPARFTPPPPPPPPPTGQ